MKDLNSFSTEIIVTRIFPERFAFASTTVEDGTLEHVFIAPRVMEVTPLRIGMRLNVQLVANALFGKDGVSTKWYCDQIISVAQDGNALEPRIITDIRKVVAKGGVWNARDVEEALTEIHSQSPTLNDISVALRDLYLEGTVQRWELRAFGVVDPSRVIYTALPEQTDVFETEE